MRDAQLIPHVTAAIEEAFDADVAEAITGDDMLKPLARRLNRDYDTPEQITAAITAVAEGLDDGTADWLVEHADSPAGWVLSRI